MINCQHIMRKLRSDTSGVAAVEAAIIMPFLGVIGLAVMDSSYMLLQNHKMEQALVSAGNFMALARDPRLVETEAKQIAVTGSTDPSAAPLIKNWAASDISISYAMTSNASGEYRGGEFIRVVNITTTHPYDGFGIVKAMTGNRVTLNAQYQQRMTGAVN